MGFDMHQPFFRPLPEDDILDLEPEVSSEGEVMEQAPLPSQRPKLVVVTPGKATMKFVSPWTDEAKEIVRRFWGKMPAARIADLIPGVNGRNAVISMAHRMGVAKPGLGHRPPPGDCKRGQGTPWTPADVELLRSLCAAGKTHDEVSEALGRSKSSIKHACKHYKIDPPVAAIAATRRAAQASQAQAQAQAEASAAEEEADVDLDIDDAVLPAPGGFRVVTISELEHGMCRWPIDTKVGVCYCGRGPIANQPSGAQSPYCAKHVAIAYVPSRQKQSERTQTYLSKIA
jgi:hypothetical protein